MSVNSKTTEAKMAEIDQLYKYAKVLNSTLDASSLAPVLGENVNCTSWTTKKKKKKKC